MGASLYSEGGGTVTGTSSFSLTTTVASWTSGVDGVGGGQHPANAAPAAVKALKRRNSRRLILLLLIRFPP